MMTEELLTLGILTQKEVKKQDSKWPAYKKIFYAWNFASFRIGCS